MTYSSFLARKQLRHAATGIDVQPDDLCGTLFDWQRHVVAYALRKGRAALFLDTGLGKTGCQIVWSDEVCKREKHRALILAPLAVAQQTVREGAKFGVAVNLCRNQDDVRDGVNVANYDRLHLFDPGAFGSVVLDESSILKSFSGKTRNDLTRAFAATPYRLCCTATPSPNDYTELLTQAEFLGIITRQEALARWFINDLSDTGTFRLKRHAVRDFFAWVASWAVGATKPSDLGYSDDGYVLPPLNVHEEMLDVDLSGGDDLFRIPDVSATGYNAEKRRTLTERVARCAEIANDTTDQVLVWCYLQAEAAALAAAIPGAVEIAGSDTPDAKERAAMDFVDGRIRVLVSKPSIFGFGLNFQQCHRVIFCGLSYSYESYYQAVRRVWRFGQRSSVDVHVVMASTEKNVLDVVHRKAGDHDTLMEYMTNEIGRPVGRAIPDRQTVPIRLPEFIKGAA